MPIPLFLFTSYKNSFKILVENLENLLVEQIQEIEDFVKTRNGFFDFNTYSFTIQKKIDFFEFEKIMQNSSLKVKCFDKPIEKITKKRVNFGQYKGMMYSELSDSYLLWLKTNYYGKEKLLLESELKRRKL